MIKDLNDNIRVGFVVKNVLSKNYKTAFNNTVKNELQYRAGVSFRYDWIPPAADLDLTENKGLRLGYPRHYASVGAEINVRSFLHFRADLQLDLKF